MARRDPGVADARFPARWGGGDREYREYLRKEQRSQPRGPRRAFPSAVGWEPGCIAGRMQPDLRGLLSCAPARET